MASPRTDHDDPYQHVNDLWDEAAAERLDPLGRLVYRSNLLGADQRITNTGGGNTSAKLTETDPLTSQPRPVLWVKGSGGDLRTAGREHFASLDQERLLGLRSVYDQVPAAERGPKTAAEDRMVGLYPHCTFGLNPRASSIDTPLHGFVPARHVDHTHPNAVIALAASREGEALTREVYGDEVLWTPWQRPGFELGLHLQELCRRHPQARGVILGQHGLINWAEDDRECYELSLTLIEKAARFLAARDRGEATFGGARHAPLDPARRQELLVGLLPWLRGQVSRPRRQVATVSYEEPMMRFVNSHDAARLAALGTSCPDHFLRTKIKPLFVDWDPHGGGGLAGLRERLAEGLERYRLDYADYYQAHRRPDSPPMRDPNPTVVLVPGLGLIAWGKDKSESRVTAEFYGCAVEVMRGAEAVGGYVALPAREAFDIEYWALEEAKLRRQPPEKELARRVCVVVGAGSGIGRELAGRLAREGAQVVCADLSAAAAAETAHALNAAAGPGLGVAGSGVSGCGTALALEGNVTERASVAALFDQAVLAYGGFDAVAVTAGVFFAPDAQGRVADERWATTFAINVTGSYVVAEEAAARWRLQGLGASLVLTSSANAVVAKKGSLAYDASKAALNHLTRELAIELAPLVRVNAVAPATVVAGSAMFPRDRVIASLAKYGLAHDENDSEDVLRGRLAAFYADRTLTKAPITPADQAEALFLLVGERLGKTTGQILAVDGGLHEAFLR